MRKLAYDDECNFKKTPRKVSNESLHIGILWGVASY